MVIQADPIKQVKAKSSSSSEFVFNPDPNFLAKINENMMNNDRVGNNMVAPHHESSESHHSEHWVQQPPGSEQEDWQPSEQEWVQPPEQEWVQPPEQEWEQQDSVDKTVQDQQAELQIRENNELRNEMISDCGSDI